MVRKQSTSTSSRYKTVRAVIKRFKVFFFLIRRPAAEILF